MTDVASDTSIDCEGNITNFLIILYDMVSEEKSDSIISWCQQGSAIIIKNRLQFSDQVLPQHFKHNTYQSFVRQLNMYGFRKVRNDDICLEFSHPSFRQGEKHLLRNIKRKSSVAHYHAALHGMKKRQIDDAKTYLCSMAKKLKKVKQRQTYINLHVDLLKSKCKSLGTENQLLQSLLIRDSTDDCRHQISFPFPRNIEKYSVES